MPRILLVNPPIHDFAAYDFWLKPYGLLRVAGFLRGKAKLKLFDYLDRQHPVGQTFLSATVVPPKKKLRQDRWGRGEFHSAELPRPQIFAQIPRRYHRFGLPRESFQHFLGTEQPYDIALIQTVMTYWYPGVQEVIADIRARSPQTKIVLGGVYATLCPEHAKALRADFVVDGLKLDPLWRYLELEPDPQGLPFWDDYANQQVGVLKLADGCPFKCTYCSVPQVYPTFHARPLDQSLAEYEALCQKGVQNIAFYDDALLYQPERILRPFLEGVLKRPWRVNFHTPNALNARFIDADLAKLMVEAGFKIVYLGFESSAIEWQRKTGGKVYSHELERAVENLLAAGAEPGNLNAYLILGHPQADQQHVEESMRFAHRAGLRIMLAEFSPIPGTPDGEACRKWVDLDEPLYHCKTAFPIISMGAAEVSRMKQVCRELNEKLASTQKSPALAGL